MQSNLSNAANRPHAGALWTTRRPRGAQRVLCQAPIGAATAAPAANTSSKPLLQRHQRLKDPAHIGAEGSSTVNVRDMSDTIINSRGVEEDVSLDAYMRLPVEQYYILDPSQIQFLSGNTFVLSVPKINLLTATLQPVIQVQVTTEQDAVVLQAVDCKLNATGLLDDLDSKFAMQFTTKLTWKSQTQSRLSNQRPQQQMSYQVVPQPHLEPHKQPMQQQQQPMQQQQQPMQQQQLLQQNTPPQPANSNGHISTGANKALSATADKLRSGWHKLRSVSWDGRKGGSNGSNEDTSSQNGQAATTAAPASAPGSISGTALVQVWCEIVPPFHLMPREVLERSCNAVISGLVNSLLPWFMRQLAADYQKWAADEEYRAKRRQRTEAKKQQQQKQQQQQQKLAQQARVTV